MSQENVEIVRRGYAAFAMASMSESCATPTTLSFPCVS